MKPSPAGRSLGPTYLPLGVKYSGQHLTEHHIARGAHSACTQCEGELDESIWKKLEDEMLADRATIAHHRAHLAVLQHVASVFFLPGFSRDFDCFDSENEWDGKVVFVGF